MKKIADISNINGNVNLNLLFNLDYIGIIAKASEGTTYVDRYYKQNYNNAKKAGKLCGAYFFARFKDLAKAKTEIDTFLRTIAETSPDFVVLDAEQDCSGDMTDICLYVLNAINKIAPAVIYCNPTWIKDHLNANITKYPLWIAHYGVSTPTITPWNKYAMWQYTEKGQISGIDSYVDLNYITDDFINSLKGYDNVENIVIYKDGADQRAAEYLADSLSCPTINNARKFDFSKVNNVYAVGGKKEDYTSYLKTLITGATRYETMQNVLSFIKEVK